ncbi:MAG: hypothetical protein JWQ61_635 [Collimonas fungivorans]|uniref:hypothetical protein n=1 Tax=Collimonas fungivorans TaxID=158899 RepID=UPI0026F0E6F9|nr:hypothetical protein [Collimonas fungivorans]MDB5765821.1 hypothetical protein [Collimonas fungivorans]
MKRFYTFLRKNPLSAVLLCVLAGFALIKGIALGIAYLVSATLKLGVVTVGLLLALKMLLLAAWLASRAKKQPKPLLLGK